MIFEPGAVAAEDTVSIRVFPVQQPIGSFYVGIMSARDLRYIAFADTRKKKEKEVETYSGIQRELSDRRQKEIRDYIGTFDAAFPNSFIIAVDSKDVMREEDGWLVLRSDERTASIIDGQHRLSGFTDLNETNFDLIVSIFIDLPIEEQAMLFATINIKQTRVNPSLVYDLYEETKLRSPQKTAHHIAKSLNTDSTSPLYHEIKPLGKRTEEYAGRLTQATFIRRLLPLICSDPDVVLDKLKRREQLSVDDPTNRDCVFWRFFVEEKDWAILRALTNYFNAVAAVFGGEWKNRESPLARTIGFGALMRILEIVANKGLAVKPEARLDQPFFEQELAKAKPLAPFTFDVYPASGAGETKLFKALEAAVSDARV